MDTHFRIGIEKYSFMKKRIWIIRVTSEPILQSFIQPPQRGCRRSWKTFQMKSPIILIVFRWEGDLSHSMMMNMSKELTLECSYFSCALRHLFTIVAYSASVGQSWDQADSVSVLCQTPVFTALPFFLSGWSVTRVTWHFTSLNIALTSYHIILVEGMWRTTFFASFVLLSCVDSCIRRSCYAMRWSRLSIILIWLRLYGAMSYPSSAFWTSESLLELHTYAQWHTVSISKRYTAACRRRCSDTFSGKECRRYFQSNTILSSDIHHTYKNPHICCPVATRKLRPLDSGPKVRYDLQCRFPTLICREHVLEFFDPIEHEVPVVIRCSSRHSRRLAEWKLIIASLMFSRTHYLSSLHSLEVLSRTWGRSDLDSLTSYCTSLSQT